MLDLDNRGPRTLADPFGNRIECVQDMFRQFGCRFVSKLRMRRDGVLDQFETSVVGRLDASWRRHHVFLFSRACSLVPELPAAYDVTLLLVVGGEYGHGCSPLRSSGTQRIDTIWSIEGLEARRGHPSLQVTVRHPGQ